MGFIKEPEGIDFVIKSERLTDKDRQEISAFIRSYKEKKAEKVRPRSAQSRAKADKV